MASETTIRFGTDGWRALIARDYTFANVRACAEGVCRLLEQQGMADRGLVVGYDSRFGSAEFALEAALVSAAHGIRTHLSDRVAPTPVLSYNLLRLGAGGGVVITASHNSGLWNGFKYKPDYGGSASPEITARLEGHIAEALEDGAVPTAAEDDAVGRGLLLRTEMAPSYLANLASVVDLEAVRGFGPAHRVRCDARRRRGLLHGRGRRRQFDRHGAARRGQPRLPGHGPARAHRAEPGPQHRRGEGRPV